MVVVVSGEQCRLLKQPGKYIHLAKAPFRGAVKEFALHGCFIGGAPPVLRCADIFRSRIDKVIAAIAAECITPDRCTVVLQLQSVTKVFGYPAAVDLQAVRVKMQGRLDVAPETAHEQLSFATLDRGTDTIVGDLAGSEFDATLFSQDAVLAVAGHRHR